MPARFCVPSCGHLSQLSTWWDRKPGWMWALQDWVDDHWFRCIISSTKCIYYFYVFTSFCLVSLLVQLRPARQSDLEEIIKEFSAKLSLVPLPPPGQLRVVRKYSFPLFDLRHVSVSHTSVPVSRCFCVVEFQPASPSSGSSVAGGAGPACY